MPDSGHHAHLGQSKTSRAAGTNQPGGRSGDVKSAQAAPPVAAREETELRLRSGHACMCLCPLNHPTVRGCCTADATTTVQKAEWPRPIAMCANCAAATEQAAEDRS